MLKLIAKDSSIAQYINILQTWKHMNEFKFDDGDYFEVFEDVFMRVLHHGTNVDLNGCSPVPRVNNYFCYLDKSAF